MTKSICLINPKTASPNYSGSEFMNFPGQKPVAALSNLTLTTLAAMIPKDFHVTICDEYISLADFEDNADYIGITGTSIQWERMKTLASAFRNMGKTVIIGGPFASQVPEIVRPYCDILVRGEIENISDRLFSDLRESCWKEEYTGDWPDMTKSPVPKSDIYPRHTALMGGIQTSRGCPFQCEFCEVAGYNGRKQRYKSASQVIAELDALYLHGFRNVLICDDNFTANRKKAKELLAAISYWNDQHGEKVLFSTGMSLELADDDELLDLCAEAGIFLGFLGIETPNKESLRETRKYQNLGGSVPGRIQRFLDHGIMVSAGMIVGFDSDKTDIFEDHFRFAMSNPIPILTPGPLMAPIGTSLYERLEKEGRLADTDYESVIQRPHWDTNIIPGQMTREQLLEGSEWLITKLYDPINFEERVLNLIGKIGGLRKPVAESSAFMISNTMKETLKQITFYYRCIGSEEEKMLNRVVKELYSRPKAVIHVLSSLMRYAQIRYCISRMSGSHFS